jgi:hypothetical protein
MLQYDRRHLCIKEWCVKCGEAEPSGCDQIPAAEMDLRSVPISQDWLHPSGIKEKTFTFELCTSYSRWQS